MNLQGLIQRFRTLAGDVQVPHLWDNDTVTAWLNEAQEQAAIRGRLIHEDANPDVCRIALTPGVTTYPLHPALFEFRYLALHGANGCKRQMHLKSVEWLDRSVRDWRELDKPACFAIQNDTSLRVVGQILAGDELVMECYRLPLVNMADGADVPEIHREHHKHLVHYALAQAFGTVDADGYDPKRAELADEAFADHFGLPVDSDMRRIRREDTVQHNEAIVF